MFNGNSPSLADIAAVTGNNRDDGFFGGEGIWAVIIFAMIFGWGGFGGFGGGFGGANGAIQGYATQADIMRGFDNQTVVSKLDGISNGLCSLGYDQLSQMNNINQNISNGFNSVDRAICDLGYQTQNGFNTTNVALMQAQNALQTQLANCCCENREGQAQIRYDMATQACETRQAIADSTRNILDFLTQDKIATLTAENQSLKFQASQTAQNAFITANQEAQTAELIRRINPMPIPAYTVPAPYAYAGCSNGCC